MNINSRRCYGFVGALITWMGLGTVLPATTPAPQFYETGYSDIIEFTSDLYRALAADQRSQFHPFPVLLENLPTPVAQPRAYFDGSKSLQAVHVTPSFIALMNSISHAKAIDDVQKGFFKAYVERLGLETGVELPRTVQEILQTKSWSLETKNYQMSRFNQMVGAVIAIEMAHQYLGHYQKYADQLADALGQPVAINQLVTPEEWHQAVLEGAQKALDCGLGVEGLEVLYDSIGAMPKRPAWTVYFLPAKAKVSKIKRDLNKLEKDFFLKKSGRS